MSDWKPTEKQKELLQEEIVIPKGIWDTLMQELKFIHPLSIPSDIPPIMMTAEQAYHCGENRIRKSILSSLEFARELQSSIIMKDER